MPATTLQPSPLNRKQRRILARGPHRRNPDYHAVKLLADVLDANFTPALQQPVMLQPSVTLPPHNALNQSYEEAYTPARSMMEVFGDLKLIAIRASALTQEERDEILSQISAEYVTPSTTAVAHMDQDKYTFLNDPLGARRAVRDLKDNAINMVSEVKLDVHGVLDKVMNIFTAAAAYTGEQLARITTIVLAFLTCFFSNWSVPVLIAQFSIAAIQLASIFKWQSTNVYELLAKHAPQFAMLMKRITNEPENPLHSSMSDPDFDDLEPLESARKVANLDEEPIMGAFSFMTALFTGADKISKPWRDQISSVAKLARDAQAIGQMFNWANIAFEYVLDLVHMQLGVDRMELRLEKELPNFKAFMAEFAYLNSVDARRSYPHNATACQRVSDLHEKATEYANMMLRPGFNPKLASHMRAVLLMVQNLVVLVANTGKALQPDRTQPTMILLSGPPATGKTVLTAGLLEYVRSTFFPTIPQEHLVYYHSALTEWWDSYHKQRVVMLDELFQRKDQQSNPNVDYVNIINLVNTTQFKLPVAVAEMKATAYFDSDIIIGTTNVATIAPVSIEDGGAVTRRLHVDAIPLPMCQGTRKMHSGPWLNFPILPYDVKTSCPNHSHDCYLYLLYDKSKIANRTTFMEAPSDLGAKKWQARYNVDHKPVTGLGADQKHLWTAADFLKYVAQVHGRRSHNEKDKKDFIESFRIKANNAEVLPVPQEDFRDNLLQNSNFFSENYEIDWMDFVIHHPQIFSVALLNHCIYNLSRFFPGLPYRPASSSMSVITYREVLWEHVGTYFHNQSFQNNYHQDVADSLLYDLEILEDDARIARVAHMAKHRKWSRNPSKSDRKEEAKSKMENSDSDEGEEFHSCKSGPFIDEKAEEHVVYIDAAIVKKFVDNPMNKVIEDFDYIEASYIVYSANGSIPLTNAQAENIALAADIHEKHHQGKVKEENMARSAVNLEKGFTTIFQEVAKNVLETLEHSYAKFFINFVSVAVSAISCYYLYKRYVATSPEKKLINNVAHVYVYDNETHRNIWVSEDTYDRMRSSGNTRYSPSRKHDYSDTHKFLRDDEDDAIYQRGQRDFRSSRRFGGADIEHQTARVRGSTIYDIVAPNTGLIVALKNGVSLGALQLLFIEGKSAVTTAHFARCLDKADAVQLRLWKRSEPMTIPISKISYAVSGIENQDIMMLNIQEPSLNQFPSILKHINPASFFSNSISVPGALLSLTTTQRTGVCIDPVLTLAILRYHDQTVDYEFQDSKIIQKGFIKMCGSVRVGMCGAPLFTDDNMVAKKLLSMHIAGDEYGNYGYSLPLTTELISNLKEALVRKTGHVDCGFQVPDYITRVSNKEHFFPGAGDFTPLGVLPVELAVATSFESKLRASPLHSLFGEATKKPAPLKPTLVDGKLLEPLGESLKKATNRTPRLREDWVANAVEAAGHLLCREEADKCVRVLTDHEAIYGVANLEFFDAMALSKSSGWPYCTTRRKQKKDLIDKETLLWASDVMRAIHEAEDAMRKGEVPFLPFFAFLKDEKLKNIKVDAGKARAIYCAHIALLHLIRKYFLSFSANMTRRKIHNSVCVGIDPTSADWATLVRHLTQKGEKTFAGDFKEFDVRQNYQITREVPTIVNWWYDDGAENATIRKLLWECVVSPVIIYGNKVYMLDHTIPSGHPLTALANSMYSLMSFVYVWQDVYQDQPNMATNTSFFRHVAAAFYGDDNVLNVTSEAAKEFNQNTVAEPFARAGMTYTDEAKSLKKIADTRPIKEVTFLKRLFGYSDEVYAPVAPLELESIDESMYYVKKSMSVDNDLSMLAYANCLEWALHGRELFNSRVQLLKKAALEGKFFLNVALPTYDQVMDMKYARIHKIVANMMGGGLQTHKVNSRTMPLNKGTPGPSITRFTEDAGLAVARRPIVSSLPKETELCVKQIAETVSNWVRVTTVAWPIGTLPIQVLYSAAVPGFLTSIPMIARKLTDRCYMRADVHVRIIPNCAPTDVGRALMFFAPMEESRGNRKWTNTATLACLSNYYCVEIDLGSPATVTMQIPYVAPNSQFDLRNVLGSLGMLYIVVMNPFNTVNGGSRATLDVYASLQNVELCVPTPNTVIANMESEQEKKSSDGLISGIASRVSTLTKYAANIPFLAPMANTVGWVADIVDGAASTMGWCKPTNQQSVQYMSMLPAAYYTNANGLDNSISFSTNTGNQTIPDLTVFGTKVDEMSIKFLSAKKSFYRTVGWGLTQNTNDVLCTFPITPCLGSNEGGLLVAGRYNVSNAGYIASFHEFWRGSMVITVDVIKNAGHSGGLGLVFLPGYKFADVVSTVNWDATSKVVLDLKKSATGQIRIDFQANKPWYTTDFSSDLNHSIQDYNSCPGFFALIVLNPLGCANNVPQTIEINLSYAMCEDFEVAAPNFGLYRPTANFPSIPGAEVNFPAVEQKVKRATPRLKVRRGHVDTDYLAIEDADPDEQVIPPSAITLNDEAKSAGMWPSKACMGESNDSLRVLTRRFGTILQTTEPGVRFDSSYFGDVTELDGQVPLFAISYLYAFFTGGTRFKMFLDLSSSTAVVSQAPSYVDAWLGFEYNVDPFRDDTTLNSLTAGTFSSQSAAPMTNTTEIAVPFYRSKPILPISSVRYTAEDFRPTANFLVSNYVSPAITPCNKRFLRAAADDFSFGYVVGAPTIEEIE